MDTAPIVTRLWDYGWLCHDTVQLSAAASDLELVQKYVASPAFHTSFLPSDKDETGTALTTRAIGRIINKPAV